MAKLIAGVGFFDRNGPYRSRVNGKTTKAYDAWSNMIRRCYQESIIKNNESYRGCKVCDEWHEFTNFAEWYYRNTPDNGNKYHLDKDILSGSGKVYSPETCLMVTRDVNNFFLDSAKTRWRYMIGVHFDKQTGRFRAACRGVSIVDRSILGRFESELDAHMAWRAVKSRCAYALAMSQDRAEVKNAILEWKRKLDENEIYKIATN